MEVENFHETNTFFLDIESARVLMQSFNVKWLREFPNGKKNLQHVARPLFSSIYGCNIYTIRYIFRNSAIHVSFIHLYVQISLSHKTVSSTGKYNKTALFKPLPTLFTRNKYVDSHLFRI